MAIYTYKSINSGEHYEFEQSINDEKYTQHPLTGEPLERIIVSSVGVKYKGIRKHVRVNKKSPAATACGCASGPALAKQMYANSKTTPNYNSVSSLRTVTGDISKPKHVANKQCCHGHGGHSH